MVTKAEKPREVMLSRGSILPSELVSVVTSAWEGATGVFDHVAVVWDDGHSAAVRKLDELAPIEDAEGISSLAGNFTYEDGSELKLALSRYSENTMSAKGQTARQRQAVIAQQWATFPKRGRWSAKSADRAESWSASFLAVVGFLLLISIFDEGIRNSATWAAVKAGVLILSWCLFLSVRATVSVRASRKLVTLDRSVRRSAAETWTIIAGVAGVLALALALITYFYPRK